METLNLIQGTPEWNEARLNFGTASEAPAMMGRSKYMSRNKLLDLKKTGIAEEVDPHTQRIFDRGHAAEASIRPVIEKLIGAELYPVTGTLNVDGVPLLASFDGITMMEDVVFEHKLWNAELAEDVANESLDAHYTFQLEQQLLVSGAEKAIFVCSDGTEDNMVFMWYTPQPGRAEKLVAGWRQFFVDLEAHEVTETKAAPVVESIESLPVLAVQINGSVSSSNLAEYKTAALAFIKGINTNLQTDTDFANAENAVKFCKNAEDKLKQAKEMALSQTADISALFATIDELSGELSKTRLFLSKEVTRKKEEIKKKIVSGGVTALQAHIADLSKELEGLQLPPITADFAGAIKGKRNLESMKDAVDTVLAHAKIEADSIAKGMRENLAIVAELNAKGLLFDLPQVITKPSDDFRNLVNSRIAEQKKVEEKERERIREEERQRLEAEQKMLAEENATPIAETGIAAEEAETSKPETQKVQAAGSFTTQSKHSSLFYAEPHVNGGIHLKTTDRTYRLNFAEAEYLVDSLIEAIAKAQDAA